MHRIEILCIAFNTIQFNAVNRITKVEKVDLFDGGYNALHILICGSNKIEVSLKVAAFCVFHSRCARERDYIRRVSKRGKHLHRTQWKLRYRPLLGKLWPLLTPTMDNNAKEIGKCIRFLGDRNCEKHSIYHITFNKIIDTNYGMFGS